MAEDAADRLVARAIESVLDQVPGSVDTTMPEPGSAKLQPWAETAAPVGRNKRPLEELLAELEQRVAADPRARATLPRTRHPALAFFDRFGRQPGQPATGSPAGEGGSKRRRRRRGGGQGGQPAETVAAAAGAPADRPQGGRRRSRRGRGGSGSGGGTGGAAQTPGTAPAGTAGQSGPAGQPRAPGSGGRRRRGRRGRGGDRQPPG
jgi:hypothetical protein